jgi:hypothetical protein
MRAARIVDCSPYGLVCSKCEELMIAPELSEYLGKREVRHFWCCENCGHKLEMTVDLRSAPRRIRPRGLDFTRSRSLHEDSCSV